MARRTYLIEWGLQTTRTRTPRGCLRRTADASDFAFGTCPPAAGWTDLSGRGSGQYDVRSTCAKATVASSAKLSAATTATSRVRRCRWAKAREGNSRVRAGAPVGWSASRGCSRADLDAELEHEL